MVLKVILTEENGDMNSIMNKISSIESKDVFGGEKGIQKLVKNIDLIYKSQILNYNQGTSDSTWYEKDFIESKYKTLTGRVVSINDIRKKENVEDVIKYYEYTQFKKGKFECTGTSYNNFSGKIESLNFKYKGLN